MAEPTPELTAKAREWLRGRRLLSGSVGAPGDVASLALLLAEVQEEAEAMAAGAEREEVARLKAERDALREENAALRMTELPRGWMAAPKLDWDTLRERVRVLEDALRESVEAMREQARAPQVSCARGHGGMGVLCDCAGEGIRRALFKAEALLAEPAPENLQRVLSDLSAKGASDMDREPAPEKEGA